MIMMKKTLILVILLTASFQFSALAATTSDKDEHFADLVNPLVGSLSSYQISTGNTYPAIAMPWGMNFWMPQTGKMGDGWAYTYTATKIRGFKQTHQPSPWINDYGQFSLMPQVGKLVYDEEKRASWFSHKTEEARPYYYKVYLADYDVTTEMAPTERANIMRFTFPETGKNEDELARVIIDAFDRGSAIEVDADRSIIRGYTTRNSGGVPENFRNYFVIKFDRPLLCWDIQKDSIQTTSKGLVEGNHVMASVGFKTRKGEQICARIASSFISFEQAELNLRELGNDDFETVKAKGRKCWDEILGRVEVDDENIDHIRTFYSCLYRATLFPRMFYEKNAAGEIVHYSPYNGEVKHGYMFTDTGFWDTFRSLFPLVNLLYPSMGQKMLAGLVNTYKESGFLPEWASPGHRGCMVGNNSAAVVADAMMNLQFAEDGNVAADPCKLSSKDCETLWEALVHGANAVHPEISSTGRMGFEEYNRLGYVPCNIGINESAARTLEYAYDDWCILQVGKLLGKSKKELEVFAKHALNYKSLFNPKYNLMQGRKDDGSFDEPFSPFKWGGAFTEGNSWHYTWSVFHDPEGLINLMGGKQNFVSMLDSVFIVPPVFDDSYYGFVIHEIREMQIAGMGNYAHGNQPIQHMIYLYDYAGEPWKTQYWVRETMNRMYAATPDGYCGDEDNGQTSAWYVFSALGFYSVCPASGQYALGTPYFDEVTLHFENGKTLCIKAEDNSDSNRYVKEMTFNSKEYTRNFVLNHDLLKGGDIVYKMASEPNLQRGIAKKDLPYSFSR
ncbi:MAG: GH92 family glycosyl hydrolase [Prevotella sp.]|nr:GH92 family glycosyl hydrolase [Prevotella sp.]